MVGSPGFEPGITRTQTAYRAKLDHDPATFWIGAKQFNDIEQLTIALLGPLKGLHYWHQTPCQQIKHRPSPCAHVAHLRAQIHHRDQNP